MGYSLDRGVLTCQTGTEVALRREWRELSITERRAYVEAVTCLTTKPSRLHLNTSLFDDFTYVHINLVYRIHQVAATLPWHRYFISIYEAALREECGLAGYLP